MKKLLRVFCYFAYYFFAKHLPETNSPGGALFGWLRFQLMRHMVAECGKPIDVNQGAHFGMGRELRMGNHCGLGKNCVILGPVTMGNYVGMSFNVFISGYDREFRDLDTPMMFQGARPDRPVVIDDDVIILANVTILSGVRIQSGAVLASGAMVTKNIPRNAIVGGNPAKIVKWRGPTSRDAFDPSMTPIASEKLRDVEFLPE